MAPFFETQPEEPPLSVTGPDSVCTDPVASPCIGVCTLSDNGLCMGCFRSMEEIANWLHFTETEKKRIMAELPGRLAVMFTT